MSIIQLHTGEFGCAVWGNKLFQMHHVGQIITKPAGQDQADLCTWHKWEGAGSEEAMLDLGESREKAICSYSLLLPKMTTLGEPSRNVDAIYTLIESRWRAMVFFCSVSLPHCQGVMYGCMMIT